MERRVKWESGGASREASEERERRGRVERGERRVERESGEASEEREGRGRVERRVKRKSGKGERRGK